MTTQGSGDTAASVVLGDAEDISEDEPLISPPAIPSTTETEAKAPDVGDETSDEAPDQQSELELIRHMLHLIILIYQEQHFQAMIDHNDDPDEIRDSANGFLTAGFVAGMVITVSGDENPSANNNGPIAATNAPIITIIFFVSGDNC